MPEVTCADCGQRIGADLYTHGITDDIYDLVNLCGHCALKRLQLARTMSGGPPRLDAQHCRPETAQRPDRTPRVGPDEPARPPAPG